MSVQTRSDRRCTMKAEGTLVLFQTSHLRELPSLIRAMARYLQSGGISACNIAAYAE